MPEIGSSGLYRCGTVGWEPVAHPKNIEKTSVFALAYPFFVAGFVVVQTLFAPTR
jgi:hypothetical protein